MKTIIITLALLLTACATTDISTVELESRWDYFDVWLSCVDECARYSLPQCNEDQASCEHMCRQTVLYAPEPCLDEKGYVAMKDIDLNDLTDPQKRQDLRNRLHLKRVALQAELDAVTGLIRACDAMSPGSYRTSGQ